MPSKSQTDSSSLQELKRSLKKGELKNLYVFYGEESYLREYYVREIKKALLPAGLDDFNLHTVKGKNCSAEWLEQTADCLPMMSEHTMILVTDFDLFGCGEKETEKLLSLFHDLPDYCCLVFDYDLLPYSANARSKLGQYLKKAEAVVSFPRQPQGDLINWVTRRFLADHHTIDPADAQYLIFLCGDLMTNLISEIGKISSYSKEKQIRRSDIDAVAIPQIDAVVYQMTDAIAAKDFNRAASVLADLLHDQQSPFMILAALGKYFRQLYTARLCLEAGQSQTQLMSLWKMKSSYQAERLLTNARKFSLAWCRFAVRRCAETDLTMKQNFGSEEALLIGLLMELSAGRKVVT